MGIEVLKAFRAVATPASDAVFEGITVMGEAQFYIVALAILYWCVNKTSARYLIGILLSGALLNSVLKGIFHTPRPFEASDVSAVRVHTAEGGSFPSGHTQAATVFFGSLAAAHSRRWWMGVLCILCIALVGISRLALAVHWPIDVLGGWAIGAAVVYVGRRFFRSSRRSNMSASVVGATAAWAVVMGMIFFKDPTYVKAAGAFVGFVAGAGIERKWVRFDVKGNWRQHALKLFIGILCILALYAAFRWLPAIPIIKGIRNAVVVMAAMAGVPWVFVRLGLCKREGTHT